MDDLRDRLEWFKSVILPYEAALRARLRASRKTREDTDDIVAEALARAYANPHWRSIDRGRAYLFAIARNHLIDQVRRDKIVSFDTITDLDALQSDTDLEAQLCARDQLRWLGRVIESMPPQAAQVFVKRRIDKKSPREIAEEMGLSVSTVEKHLSKAIRLCMRAMAEQEADCVEQGQCDEPGRDRAASR